MRNLTPARPEMSRRGSNAGLISPLSSPNQSRYKGLISTPGVVKFSAWKRDTEIPKTYFHEFILEKIEERAPEKVWMRDISSGRTETYGQIRKAVNCVASGLTKIGFKAGDVICMYSPNYVDYWIICLAVWSCGGCVMPTNCELEPKDLECQIMEANVKFIVCDDLNLNDALDVADNVGAVKHVITIGTEKKDKSCIIPIGDLLSDDCKTPPPPVTLNWESDVVFLPFTSTTGGSRGITHSHKSLISCFFSPEGAANHWFDQAVGDSVACGVMFFHMTGLYAAVLSTIYGLSLYTLSDYSDGAFLDMIVDHKTSTAAVYPWQVRMLSQSPEVAKYNLACLKVLITGGSILSATIRMEVLERIESIKIVREAYGMNECGIVCLTYPREKKNSVTASKVVDVPDDHVMPVGLPNMYSQIKVIDRQSGCNVSGPDQQGEICVKSPQCFLGYLNGHDLNNKVFDSEGYFHTGDVGYYDSNGVVYFIEKIENFIHFWMYEVAPSILESRLLGSNNIVDAAVVGIPNKENGEVPRAFVVLRPGFEETEENLTNLMESRLQDHERIRGGLYFIQDIPRDENWKVRRDVLESYSPMTTEEMEAARREMTEEQKALASMMASSPKIKRSPVVRELEKQPNGSFICNEQQEARGPRTSRASHIGERDKTTGFGGSPSVVTTGWVAEEEKIGSSAPGAGARRRSIDHMSARYLTSSGNISHGSRRGSFQDRKDSRIEFGPLHDVTYSYWSQVKWHPKVLEDLITTHQAVEDCVVREFHLDGVGHLPRAYVVLKHGYSLTAEELHNYVDSLSGSEFEKIRAGIVFLDKIARDPDGHLLINVDKLDKHVEGFDYDFIKSQPRVKM